MNILLTIGFLLTVGYTIGWLLERVGVPRIIGYIVTGIAFSPNTINLLDHEIIKTTTPLMEVCLAFITFEVGGALKWSKIKRHEKEIVSITFLASLFPYLIIAASVYVIGLLFPSLLPVPPISLLLLALLLGALASPTEPAATLAVMHQYKAKGKVTDTILGVAALDDVLGILLFSLTIAIIFIFTGGQTGLIANPVTNSLYEIFGAILIGALLGLSIDPISRLLQMKGEGQWVVILFSLIISCNGLSQAMDVDALLASMTMGMVMANKCGHHKLIFKILERYTEDLIFLFFFLLSGLYLNISTIPQATSLIVLFVVLRTIGKFIGANMGARVVSADPKTQKHAAGGLLPQGGIVIGLVLSIYGKEQFQDVSEILLTTIMGTVVIHELVGPIAAKYSLWKAGEIKMLTKGKTADGHSSKDDAVRP